MTLDASDISPQPIHIPTPQIAVGEQLEKAGVPPRFLGHRLRTYRVNRPDQALAVQGVERVVTGYASLVLTGPTGTGKTHLVVSALALLAEGDRLISPYVLPRGLFVVVPELLDAVRGTIRYAEADDPMARLMDVPLLVLDDLGAEKPTEWVFDRLYVLVNHRYNAKLVTVVTTNYSVRELDERGYGRIISRLMEDANVVVLDGPDERLSTHNPPSYPQAEVEDGS
jgi:DNA replication protein DnaC